MPTCPTGAITFVEREAAAYDEKAVMENKQRKMREQGMTLPLSLIHISFEDNGSAHIGSQCLVDLGLQRLGLRLAGDSADDGITHDAAARCV